MQKQTCLTCHGDNLQGGPAAPALTGIDLSPEEIANIAKMVKAICQKVFSKVQIKN